MGARIVALAACCAPAVLLAACAGGRGFPPLWEREEGLPGGLVEERALFRVATRTTGEDGARLSALRPLIAVADDGAGLVKVHALAPLGLHSEDGDRRSTALRPIFYDTEFTEPDPAGPRRDDDTMVLPLLAWGDDPDEGSYLAVFPLGGTLKGKLLADRLDFVAFPCYVHTRREDWESTHLLWPLIAWGDSPTRSHRRFLPLWSQTDGPTQHRRTLLWPLFHWATEVRDDRTFESWFAFPLLGRRTSTDGTYGEWTALWPFFEWSHDDRTGGDTTSILWPIHTRVTKPGVSEKLWWWPAWGHYRDEEEDSSFYAWPLVWSTDVTQGGRTRSRRYVVPLWMSRTSGPTGAEPDEEELRSWPLFSYRRTADGNESVRVPSINPFFDWEAGDTLYADLVALVRWSADDEGRVAWDGPLGVVRYRRDEKGSSKVTLLWWIDIPLGGPR